MRTCTFCDLPQLARGMCRVHYLRWYRLFGPEQARRFPVQRVGCSVSGCEAFARKRGLCARHYDVQWRRLRRVKAVSK